MSRAQLATLVICLMLIPIVADCDNDDTVQPPESNHTDLVFVRDPASAPVILSGSEGWPIFPTDPGVIADAEGYHLFYTSYFCKAKGDYYYSWDVGNLAACNILDVVATIGYAFSADSGYTWVFRHSPVVMPGAADWHCGDLETPHAAVLTDTLYLFYSATGTYEGNPFPQRYQVGVAVLDLQGRTIRRRLLDDDADFTQIAQPLLPYNTTTTTYENNTQEPSVVIRNGKLEVYYVGLGLARPDLPAEAPGQTITTIGMARAVFTPNLTLVEKSNGYILPDANITEAKYFDGAYYVFATAAGAGEFHCGENIVCYISADGIAFSESKTLLRSAVDFDGWGLMAPTLVVGEKEIVLFYTGWSCEDHPCFPEPLPPDTRFGRPSDEDRTCIYGAIGRAVAARTR